MINPLKRVEVNHYTLRHPRVDKRARGLVLAQITDIHLGRWIKPRHVRDIAAYVNARAVDLAVMTGDYVGYDKRDLKRCVQALDALEVPGYAVLGNHDHWASTALAVEAFSTTNLELMSNNSAPFESGRGHKVRLIGVDDAVTRSHDIEKAFEHVEDDLFRLTLCHVPSLAPDVAAAGADAIFSGHTHGLQFNVPGVARLLTRRLGVKYIGGAYEMEDCLLYVSRGLGSASWPWRYRAAPELTFFTLEHGHRPELVLDHRLVTSIAPSQPSRKTSRVKRALPAAIDENKENAR